MAQGTKDPAGFMMADPAGSFGATADAGNIGLTVNTNSYQPAINYTPLLYTNQFTLSATELQISEAGYVQDAVVQNAVLKDIAPINNYLLDAVDGILALRQTFGADNADEAALLNQLAAYIDRYLSGDILQLFPERATDQATYFPDDVDADGNFVSPTLRDSGGNIAQIIKPPKAAGTSGDANPIVDNSLIHTAIFKASQYVVDDTLVAQRLRHGVVRIKRDRLVLLQQLRKQQATLQARIAASRAAMDARNRSRLESLSDYHVAQQLVREDWEATEARFSARQAVLDAHQGLYYARVRETPLSLTLPDPLALRTSLAGDLLPGCGVQDKDLPEELEPFIDAVLDIAMGNWDRLRDQYTLLPGRQRLDSLYGQRKLRLDWRLKRGASGNTSRSGLKLAGLRNQNLSLLQDQVRHVLIPTLSLRDYQLRSRDLLSLEDLLTGPSHRLRGQAAELRDQLNQACHCLLERLRVLPPSIRLAWAEGAEQDHGFVVEEPESWPRLDQAEAQDFNAVRTLVEVVHWWFRQLHEQASGSSRSAMRNLVRACLLLAASDDPEDILHGQLKTVPGRFRPGEAMRLTLNREALPGTLLRLLDHDDRLIGTLRVDDEDDQGTVASIIQVFDSSSILATGFRVTGYRLDTSGTD